ncbi:lipid II flippase MurJ [Gandjariella thermophila]|uniref:lipid II flippase MurJ n=1 Tax=Gandjariella thermophila TaxID=1931992 RepID=UPI001863BCEB|nr:lipid II flippase MurJ [Gandjariella thermophila]
MAGWTLASRLTGLARVAVVGAVLGPTYFANTFVTASFVPTFTYASIAGTALAMVVVPATVGTLTARGVARAGAVLGGVGGFLLSVAGAIAVLAMIASPALAWLLTFGIADAAARTAARGQATVLILLVAPQIVLYAVVALAAAAQQARGRFALAAAAPAVENIGLMTTVTVAGLVYGTGREVAEVPFGLVFALGLGGTLAVATHAGLQVFGAARVGLLTRPRFRWWSDPDVAEVARRLRRAIVVPACPQVAFFILLTLAGTVPGGVVVLQAAYLVYNVPTALGARAVSTAVLPRMSAAVQRSDHPGFASAWRQALTHVAIVSLPVLLLLLFFARPLAQFLANGELRSASFVDQLAGCVMVIAVAQVVAGIHEMGRHALFARVDLNGPRLASLAYLGFAALVGLASLTLPGGTPRLMMLAAALLVGDLAGAGAVITRLRAAIHPERFADRRPVTAAAVAAAGMLPVLAAGWWLLAATTSGRLTRFAEMSACGVVALGTYAAMFRATTRPSTRRAS